MLFIIITILLVMHTLEDSPEQPPTLSNSTRLSCGRNSNILRTSQTYVFSQTFTLNCVHIFWRGELSFGVWLVPIGLCLTATFYCLSTRQEIFIGHFCTFLLFFCKQISGFQPLTGTIGLTKLFWLSKGFPKVSFNANCAILLSHIVYLSRGYRFEVCREHTFQLCGRKRTTPTFTRFYRRSDAKGLSYFSALLARSPLYIFLTFFIIFK